MLLEDKPPKSGVADEKFSDDILFYVEKYDIKTIEFGSFRRFTFIAKECEHGKKGYEIHCEVLAPSLDELLGSINKNTSVHIFSGDMEDLKKLQGDANLPDPLRKIFEEIQSKMQPDEDRDERQTHETTSTKH